MEPELSLAPIEMALTKSIEKFQAVRAAMSYSSRGMRERILLHQIGLGMAGSFYTPSLPGQRGVTYGSCHSKGTENPTHSSRHRSTRPTPSSHRTENGLPTCQTRQPEPKFTCRVFRRQAVNGRFQAVVEINRNGGVTGRNSST